MAAARADAASKALDDRPRGWPRRISSSAPRSKARGPLRRGARRICAPPPAQYPRDRVVLNQIGRVLFLKRQFDEAIAALQNGAAPIDPEDLQAHYNLMLCYQGLGDAAKAAREQALYQRFKADESAQAITGPYRQLHPDDNNERQPIHEHRRPRAAGDGRSSGTDGAPTV